MEEFNNCPVCNSSSIKKVLSATDHVATQEVFTICECSNCAHRFTNPRPQENETSKYYESSNYVSHNDQKSGLVPTLYRTIRSFNLNKKVALLKRFKSSGRVIDYGCGLGSFLNTCQLSGFDVKGFDISELARTTVKERFNIEVAPNEGLQKEEASSADFITLWHVLEHVYPLHETIKSFERILKPGGILILALPNYTSADAKRYGPFWDGYDVPRHIHHFSPHSIKELITSHGFTSIRNIPMVFDAPYVSIRSERHSKKGLSFLRGGVKGLLSNIEATKTGNYSSITYVFQKS